MRLSVASATRWLPSAEKSRAAAGIAFRCLLLLIAILAAACAPIRRAPPSALPDSEPLVRVGLAVDTVAVVIAGTGPFMIRGDARGAPVHRFDQADSVTIRSIGGSRLLLITGADTVTAGAPVTITAAPPDLVTVGGRPYRGAIRIRQAGPGTVTVINVVPMEAYLLGVVPYEIGRVGEDLLEAAKAQAVAARTYAIRNLGRRDSLGFDVFATVSDQVYGGAEGEHGPVSEAVRLTTGEILTYEGAPIEAFYHSTCAGQTAAIEEVWDEEPRPYLRSVVDVDPATGIAWDSTSNRFRWTVTWSADVLHRILRRTLADSLPPGVDQVGELLGFEVLALTPSGRIRTLRISTATGTFDVGGDGIRWIFLTPEGNILNSSKFELHVEHDALGRISQITAEGMGWGHGIGMCQVGAMGRARAGQDYRTILESYYPGTRRVRLY